MDLIHSVLVCAYNYSTDPGYLGPSVKSICIPMPPRCPGRQQRLKCIQSLELDSNMVARLSRNVFRVHNTNAPKLNWCLKPTCLILCLFVCPQHSLTIQCQHDNHEMIALIFGLYTQYIYIYIYVYTHTYVLMYKTWV